MIGVECYVDLATVVPVSRLEDQKYWIVKNEEVGLARALYEEAFSYLTSFRWCEGVEDSYVGMAIPGVLGVFAFKLLPGTQEVDEWLWIIVGDVPSAYISSCFAHTPIEAIDCYSAEMWAWVEAVKKNQSVDELIPVNVPAVPEYANMLESRLRFIAEKILKPMGKAK